MSRLAYRRHLHEGIPVRESLSDWAAADRVDQLVDQALHRVAITRTIPYRASCCAEDHWTKYCKNEDT